MVSSQLLIRKRLYSLYGTRENTEPIVLILALGQEMMAIIKFLYEFTSKPTTLFLRLNLTFFKLQMALATVIHCTQFRIVSLICGLVTALNINIVVLCWFLQTEIYMNNKIRSITFF